MFFSNGFLKDLKKAFFQKSSTKYSSMLKKHQNSIFLFSSIHQSVEFRSKLEEGLQESLMTFKNVYIPYRCYWSTPFIRWQGSFANLNSIPFAAETTVRLLKEWNLSADVFDSLYLGITVPQKHSFYGQAWLAGLIGAPKITGPMIAQACATSARLIFNAASDLEIQGDPDRTILAITCDRTSNGPHILYPNPLGPGGKGDAEDWVWDNFGFDPYASFR
jgi:hypothetical protein